MRVEVTVVPLAEAPILPHLTDLPTVAHPTIDRLDQVMEQHVRPLMVEASQMATILEAHRAGQAPILPAIALQAE